jgi:hypothetical protein
MEKIAVDHNHFDRVTRLVGAESTRRAALRGLALGLLAATGLGTAVQEISARRKGRNNNRRVAAAASTMDATTTMIAATV